MKISYNWLQNYFEDKLPSPEEISQGIIFHSFEVEEVEKVGDDTIFDIKILPDRAHDCLSHWGIAKEISMIFGLKIKDENYRVFDPKKTDLKIEVQDKKCLRYMGRIARNVKVGISPDWLKERLNAIGQRSINNLVDAANFVMFDLGQPIHCFDLDKLANPKIIVRNGKAGEKITTLDKKEVNLDDSILTIADESKALAIAGIKGGTKAEVDDNTKNIIIEVANFNPTTTRKTAKKINILTDAVKRYENEISPELCAKTMDAISDLINKLAGGSMEDIIDIYPDKIEQTVINVSIDYINKRLGSNFSKEEIKSVWEKLNFEHTEKGESFEIKVPYLRIDLKEPYDLTEEVIRVLGYDKLEEKMPGIKLESSMDEKFFQICLARQKLLNDGYSEVMTYTFRDKGEVEVLASASDKKFLRNNLSDGLKESLKLNQLNMPFLSMKDIKIFEIGTVFLKDKEELHIAWNEKNAIKETTLDKFVLENSLFDSFKGRDGGGSRKFSAENFNALQERAFPGQNGTNQIFKPWSIYPFISRDIAVWVPAGEGPGQLEKLLKEKGTDLLIREPYLFDSFTKDGQTSYAFRLVFQSYDRTLTDDEISGIMQKITEEISKNTSWKIR